MNDLSQHYASLPVEDIERLALDAASLTSGARETLRLEMERRHLPTECLDVAFEQAEPKSIRWSEDWQNTGKGARVVLISLAVLVIVASLFGAALNVLDRDFANAAAFLLPIALLGFRFVIFPFRIAWAARRRGGRFNRWLACSILFGFILVGIAYLIWKSDKPILHEYMTG